MAAGGLGNKFDIGFCTVNADVSSGFTGKRISFQNYGGIGILLTASAVGTTDDLVPSIQEHTAYTGGTSQALSVMDTIFTKSETLLDNDEAWTKVTQTTAAIMTAIAGEAEKQNMYYFEIMEDQLSDGYTHISVNHAALGTDAKLTGLIYIMFNLQTSRAPASMANALRPGAANA